ncbi:group III truncated hemoglobin [Streptomyces sp. NPDC090025]|uniref:group III truncated hemoglobin n=1 Tax=Streptomyces sp. NPDC090025 TaxID=3365922 RepID=UPI00383401A1
MRATPADPSDRASADRTDRTDRTDRAESADRADRTEGVDRAEGAEGAERIEGAVGAGRGLPDVGSRADLDTVLRRFYGAAFDDPLIGPFFTEIAGTDLEVHLPRITDFWERALFRTAEYRRDAFAPHAVLHAARPLTAAHFGRWVQLWHATLDGRHQGPLADRAKAQGERIALAMLKRLGGRAADTAAPAGTGGSGGFVPLAALTLRSAA